ncbi:MAG: bifunctional diguanylate cyclase/phosphodiesterase [Novosphingobium sp.]|nr:bifunctional diguanylate cyclase/phosphodiesterase [Novosphingobium sp.]MBX9644447.1 EAL domain-containing protein [Novosphingobium sp.]
MNLLADSNRDWRRARLFGPILAMTFGGLALLVVLSNFLVQRFDIVAAEQEQVLVEHGFARQLSELNAVVATQVDWDDAIAALDHKFDAEWVDFNVGNYLYTFNGFSHTFVLDRDERMLYAAVKGERRALGEFAKFETVARRLIPTIRRAEVARGPIRPRPGKNNIVIPPIQKNAIVQMEGTTYIVTATLVQPDFGKILPKGPRAPIVITAKPVDAAMLGAFSGRYLLDNLLLLDPTILLEGRQQIVLRNLDGTGLAALSWEPRQPGTALRRQLQWPLLGGIVMLGFLALLVTRRGKAIVNELITSETRARHLAYHDQLTQLPNRALLFERLRALLAARRVGGSKLAVICVDLDRFKEVNDTLGHHAGDELIQTVAARLRETCGDAALIARLGGDEFVVLLEFAEDAQVRGLSERILVAVAERIESEFGWLEVGCSLGVAVIDHPGVEPTEALRWADVAMYRSKDGGRSRVTFFEPEMDDALRARRSLEADLRAALGDGSLRMVYQPQVDRNGQITAVEALLRWDHPRRGAIPPGIFVPLAEETGLILPLGEFVLRRVFTETAGWSDLRVGINVSAMQLRSQGFAAVVTRQAAQAGIDPTRYEIELTETALLGDDPVTASNVEALKRLGFSIALDDFGTGYSSLSVLQRFSVNRIKIDRSFVCALDDSGEGEALVDAMVKLARSLNLSVIAEGVETEDQRKRLMACGCREFQGYLTGMPQGADSIAALAGYAASEQVRKQG